MQNLEIEVILKWIYPFLVKVVEQELLANIKIIFEHGVLCSKNNSKLMRLLAIHELHYVVELILREKAIDYHFPSPTQLLGFKEILEKVDSKMSIPEKDRLLDLNDDRNRAEHRNKIPPKDEIQFHAKITEGFLRWSYKNYFDSNFDSIALEDQIIDKPIRRVMKWSKEHIQKGDLKKASQRMYEGLGAFKFMMFGYYTDYKISKQSLEQLGLEIDFADILANFAFKMLFGDDTNTLKKLSEVKTSLHVNEISRMVRSNYPTPDFMSKEDADSAHYEILNIILTYQDKIPLESWRDNDPQENLKDD